jgi:hypothetical protein
MNGQVHYFVLLALTGLTLSAWHSFPWHITNGMQDES